MEVSKKRKFHALYDKVYRKDLLENAWEQVKSNNGVGGIDEVSIDDIKAYGEDKFLKEIEEDLKENEYQPKPVKRVYIPKKDGSKRPLELKEQYITKFGVIVLLVSFSSTALNSTSQNNTYHYN